MVKWAAGSAVGSIAIMPFAGLQLVSHLRSLVDVG